MRCGLLKLDLNHSCQGGADCPPAASCRSSCCPGSTTVSWGETSDEPRRGSWCGDSHLTTVSTPTRTVEFVINNTALTLCDKFTPSSSTAVDISVWGSLLLSQAHRDSTPSESPA